MGCHPSPENKSHLIESSPSVIYSEDTRRNTAELKTAEELQIAHSTVALMKASDFTTDGQILRSNKNYTLSQTHHYCPSEKYVQETSQSFCSGFLIAPDLVLTAGHCIDSAQKCTETLFVFDFVRTLRPYSTPSAKTYRCQKLISQTSRTSISGGDYALIQLERPVANRKPLQIDWNPNLQINMPLSLYGFPNGIPLKVDNGTLRLIEDNGNFIKTEIDSFSGSSGSPLVDSETHKVIGMLISGEDDVDEDLLFDAQKNNSCVQIKRCTSGNCRGERGVLLKSLPESLKHWIQER
ncbi:MAG: hypothetical protein BroJett040_00240 [Oligoflexia bacterium]|nr:MAG: hypothetical protein BroJett040_00240 [Oligoflexia bacterium]